MNKLFGFISLVSLFSLIASLIWMIWADSGFVFSGVSKPLAMTSLLLFVVFGIIWGITQPDNSDSDNSCNIDV